MRNNLLTTLLVIFAFAFISEANDKNGKKLFQAKRTDIPPKIDGKLDDPIWDNNAEKFIFSQFEPDNGADASYESQVQVFYDDKALYILARFFDPEPENIQRELGLRDDGDRNTDLFGVLLDTYNKGQNGFVFGVTAAGVQFDSYISNSEDFDDNWDAVWNSAVEIDEQGWVIEIEIPYYAIRFPSKDVQSWGINFYRKVQRLREESFWNNVDKSVQGFVNQSGVLEGIEGVEPPLRLAFLPYASVVHARDEATGENDTQLNGGMDLKWGLNEAFTLDMSLIPDFSQVQSDDQVLNLSAFEVRFDERRPFFTEGTELFNKGALFYSRRVGGTLGGFETITDYDTLISSPGNAPLINATKLSGRTSKGLGLGIFNGVTRRTYAELATPSDVNDYSLDANGNRVYTNYEKAEVLVDPLTNYNVFVIDQNLKNNSNIALINTNVSRTDGFENVNFTGAEFRLNDKTNTYQATGFGTVGYSAPKNGEGRKVEQNKGYNYSLFAGKVGGNWQIRVQRNVESDDYNPNDLGFLSAPNEVTHWAQLSYSEFNPVWIFNNWRVRLNFNHNQLFKHPTEGGRRFVSGNMNLNLYSQLKKSFWEFGAYGGKNTDQYDYFEPRQSGRVFNRPDSYFMGAWIGTDSRKAFYVNFDKGIWQMPLWNQHDHWHWLSARYRVSNRLSFEYNLGYTREYNSRGYVNNMSDDIRQDHGLSNEIIFGTRNIGTLEEVLGVNYTFNSKMGLNVRMRHYWRTVSYHEFFELDTNGDLQVITYQGTSGEGEPLHDINYNFFSLNFNYSWQIAPGSFLTFNWQKIIQDYQGMVETKFIDNFGGMIREANVSDTNSFSLKVTYFIDYLTLTNRIRK